MTFGAPGTRLETKEERFLSAQANPSQEVKGEKKSACSARNDDLGEAEEADESRRGHGCAVHLHGWVRGGDARRAHRGARGDRLTAAGEKKEEARAGNAIAPLLELTAYLAHPEQDAQQSAEGQHEALAAFTAPVRPNAITAINRIALMLFMSFSFLES